MLRSSILLSALTVGVIALGTQATGTQEIPAGVSDLLASTPTMLSPLRTAMDQRNKASVLRTNNTVTITGSQIVFARADKQTLVATIESMIQNSKPSKRGDEELTNMIMTVLEADGSRQENEVKTKVLKTLERRTRKKTIRVCVEELVDLAMREDEAPTPAH